MRTILLAAASLAAVLSSAAAAQAAAGQTPTARTAAALESRREVERPAPTTALLGRTAPADGTTRVRCARTAAAKAKRFGLDR